MRLTAWLPNKTLLWKEYRQNWGLALMLLVYAVYTSSYRLASDLAVYPGVLGERYIYPLSPTNELLLFASHYVGLISILLVVVLGAMMMGTERDQGTFNLLLGMPYSRWTILYHKFLAGLSLILGTYVLNALLMTVLVWTHPGVSFPFGTDLIWAWALRNLLVLGFAFTFTLLISTLSGTALGNVVLSLIFLFFPLGIDALIAFNIDFWGLDSPELVDTLWFLGLHLTVPLFIIDESAIEHLFDYISQPALYGILVLLIMGTYQLAQYLFARNPMENNGEVLMFSGPEGFFKFGVAACFTLLLVPVLIQERYPSPAVGLISYLFCGAVFWGLITWLIRWRKVTNA